jgi:redox-sensitive bicupin YhaK (pirin superfamily)
VNLPARDKMMPPRYQEVPASRIPEAASSDGRARVRVIAGEALGARAVIDTRTPITLQDWRLQPGAVVEQPLSDGQRGFVYVFAGGATVGEDERALADGQLGLLGPGTRVRLAVPAGAAAEARLLLVAGQPLGEPVARYGPFVMNTEAEILQAVRDFQAGRLGAIRRA